MNPPEQSREIRLRSRPSGTPTPDNFALETVTLSEPGPGEVQVRNTWMSVDPYMRGRMNDVPSYIPPFEIGKVLEGGAVGTVVRSNDERFKTGDHVQSNQGWREAFNAPGNALQKVDVSRLPAEAYLGVAGMPGLTAYVGMTEIAKVKAGDVVFVSAAAGAVGAVACQIAKLRGAKTVIGSAGGAEKCAYLRDEAGVDRVIDYKATEDLTAALKQAAPEGLDVYFDNVGGPHFDAAMAAAKTFARFVMCGMISQYNDDGKGVLPADFSNVIRKRLTLRGFIVSDHFDLMPRFLEEMTGWVQTGRVKGRQSVEEGIARAPAAFLKLFSGESFGKMLVKLV